MKIIDDFLTKSYHNNILNLMTEGQFDWVYCDNITTPGEGSGWIHGSPHFNNYGFTHRFWHDEEGPVGKFTPFIHPFLLQVLDVTDCDYILRARADMVTWSGKENFIHPAHTDALFPNTASVYYVNESDGDTIFYNVKPADVPKGKELKEYDRVSPKANRLVIFDGDLLHTGCSPTKYKNRILINSNYIKNI